MKNIKPIDRENSPKRYQSLYGNPVEILDLSHEFEEKSSASKPDIDIILAARLFKQDEVVIGIGKPNVFLLIPNGKGSHLRYAAKSFWRAPSRLERTGGKIQSGIFAVLKGLTEEQIERIRENAKKHEGEKSSTCVNANSTVLEDSGVNIRNSEEKLSDTQLPTTLLDYMVESGFEIDGENIDIEFVNTTNNILENQIWKVRKATYATLFRHVKRAFNDSDKVEKSDNKEEKKKSKVISMKNEQYHKKDFTLGVSNISKLAVPLRLLWGSHTIFTLKQDRVDINDYFSDKLEPYPDVNPSFFTKVKKNVLFNDKVVGFVNKFMQKGNSSFSGNSESDFYNMFEVNGEENDNKYNIVVSSSGIMVAKVKVKNKFVDWLLSKHVLVSNYNKDVRFAGEIYKGEDGIIWINNDSGTYKPDSERLDSFIEYSKEIFPHIDIRKEEKN